MTRRLIGMARLLVAATPGLASGGSLTVEGHPHGAAVRRAE